MQLLIGPDGTVHCIYGEAIDLSILGRPVIRRVSHVEADAAGYWSSDLSPSGGPRLGPFARRSQALEAEVAWLQANLSSSL